VRAFVTGGTGFLGRRVVDRLLDRGDEVVLLARDRSRAADAESRGAVVVEGDLADVEAFREALRGCDVVYHIGARVLSSGDWRLFVDANVVATERLIEAAFELGAKRFVHVSSLGIFDIPEGGVTVREDSDYDHAPLLRGYYTRSKIDADRVACAWARTGKPVVVVRPGVIYGHDHPSEPLYTGRVGKNLGSAVRVVVGRASYPTPIVYVENAADAVVRAGVVPGVEGKIFNVVDDPDLTHKTYFRALAEAHGCPARVLYVPVGLFVPMLAVVNFLHRLLKRRGWAVAYQLRRSGRSARYPTEPARDDLGWQPAVSLGDALESTVAGMKA